MNTGVSSYSFESIRKVRNLDAFGMIDLALELGFSAIEFIDIYAPEGKDKISHAKEISAYAKEKGIDLTGDPLVEVREYIHDMAVVMRAADLVLCRAGASTIAELTALGAPALMVPSPYVPNNHQEKNARALAEAGGAQVLLEKDSSGQEMFRAAAAILRHETRRLEMEKNMAALGVRDATERIYETILALCQ